MLLFAILVDINSSNKFLISFLLHTYGYKTKQLCIHAYLVQARKLLKQLNKFSNERKYVTFKGLREV